MREDWIQCKLGDIAKWGSGGTPKSTKIEYYGGDIPWLVIGDLNDGLVKKSEKYITQKGLENSSAKIVLPDNVLIAMYGSIGKLGINLVKVTTNQAIAFTREIYSGVYNKYLFNYLLYSRPALINLGKGGTQQNISQTVLKGFPFNFAPLPEQRAIVSKIEELFSSLESGIADLKKAQEQLKLYRQAILKKAFEGKLTKEWREGQDHLATGTEVLKNIDEERRKWLDEEILKDNKEAKRIKKKIEKSSVKSNLPSLPENWDWTSFIKSCLFVIDCHNKTAPYISEGIPLVRTTNVRDGKLDLKNKIKFVSDETYKFWSRRAFPKPGDIIFTREAPMGEAAIIPSDTKICLGQRTMLLRTVDGLLDNKYLLYNILNDSFQQRFREDAIGTGVKHLRVGDVENLTFPICSIEEQKRIVKEIERHFSAIDELEKNVEIGLMKTESIKLAIFKKAFEGNLLTDREIGKCKQAEDYEPASKLLEKIKAEQN